MLVMELIERFEPFDVSDSDDPDIESNMAKLQARNYEEHPELAAPVAPVPSPAVPDGAGG